MLLDTVSIRRSPSKFWFYIETTEPLPREFPVEFIMTIDDVARVLDGKVLVKEEGLDRKVGFVVASDLMSDVLLVDADDILLLTSLASDQALRTAQIVGAMGVVVHNDKPLPSSMLDVARRLGVSLVTSPHQKYASCIKIHDALEREKQGVRA